MTQSDVRRATGTYGSSRPDQDPVDKFGAPVNPVEYTSPPEAKR